MTKGTWVLILSMIFNTILTFTIVTLSPAEIFAFVVYTTIILIIIIGFIFKNINSAESAIYIGLMSLLYRILEQPFLISICSLLVLIAGLYSWIFMDE